jgi:hypothetical protein
VINSLASECGAQYSGLNVTLENGCISSAACVRENVNIIFTNESG